MGAYDTTVGVLLLGILFNTYLYGLVTYQFMVYRKTKFGDAFWIKSIVTALFIVDTIHSTVAVYAAWETCVTNYDNPSSLAFISWTIPFTAVATSVAALFTQIFLNHRVYVLTQSEPIVVLIGFFSCLAFFFGVYAGIQSGIVKEIEHFSSLVPYVICWLGCQTVADLLITGVLTYVLARSRTGFNRTDTIINRLIRGSIQTGLFASLFALGDLFSFVFHRKTNLYAMFAYPIGRIYTNTLLDTLNARAELKRLSIGEISVEDSFTSTRRKVNADQSLTFAANADQESSKDGEEDEIQVWGAERA